MFRNYLQIFYPEQSRMHGINEKRLSIIYGISRSLMTKQEYDEMKALEMEYEIHTYFRSLYKILYSKVILGTRYFVFGDSGSIREQDFKFPYEDFPELLKFVDLVIAEPEPEEITPIKALRNKYNDIDFCSLSEDFIVDEEDLKVFIEFFNSNKNTLPIEEVIKKDLKKECDSRELFAKLLIWFDSLEEMNAQQKEAVKKVIKKSGNGFWESPNYTHVSDSSFGYIKPLENGKSVVNSKKSKLEKNQPRFTATQPEEVAEPVYNQEAFDALRQKVFNQFVVTGSSNIPVDSKLEGEIKLQQSEYKGAAEHFKRNLRDIMIEEYEMITGQAETHLINDALTNEAKSLLKDEPIPW